MAHVTANVAWGSSNWRAPHSDKNLDAAVFSNVQEHGRMHEELSFELGGLVEDGRKHA